MLQATDVVIRSLRDLPELNGCVELQRQVWGFADIDTVPEAIFAVAGKTGGQVLGAFKHENLIGFALSFSAQSATRVTNALFGKELAGRSAGDCIPVPFDIQETCRMAPRDAEHIQLLLRKRFELCFDRGQAAVGFQLDDSGGKYLMEPYED